VQAQEPEVGGQSGAFPVGVAFYGRKQPAGQTKLIQPKMQQILRERLLLLSGSRFALAVGFF